MKMFQKNDYSKKNISNKRRERKKEKNARIFEDLNAFNSNNAKKPFKTLLQLRCNNPD